MWRLGYPISPSFEEVSSADGKPYLVQYFERAVLEYHPGERAPYGVQLMALGSLQLRALYPSGAPMGASNPVPSPTPVPPTATPLPTSTPLPTTTSLPTATPPPSIGSTKQFQDWAFTLTDMRTSKTITWSEFGNGFKASGNFWIIWLGATNLANTSRSLPYSVKFRLVDYHGATYEEASEANEFALDQYARLEGRDHLSANMTPRATTHPILVFDMAADAVPVQLTIVNDEGLFPSGETHFSLQR